MYRNGSSDKCPQLDDDIRGPARLTGFMIEVVNLSKRYGDTLAVDALEFTVRPGIVTGFLGPNGSGKSTTITRKG